MRMGITIFAILNGFFFKGKALFIKKPPFI